MDSVHWMQRGLPMSSRPFNVRKKSMLLDKSKQINTWKQPQNDLLMAVADKWNSKFIWILDINKVITLWTENPFNGCIWIRRGWQIKGQRPWKANLANPLWLFSFYEWRSILCTFASKVSARITQVALQLGSRLFVKSVASRPVEVKRGHTFSPLLIPLVIYFLLQYSPLYWEFNTFPWVQRLLIGVVYFVFKWVSHTPSSPLSVIGLTPASTLDSQLLQSS